jgi:hypothetical protein
MRPLAPGTHGRTGARSAPVEAICPESDHPAAPGGICHGTTTAPRPRGDEAATSDVAGLLAGRRAGCDEGSTWLWAVLIVR